MNARLRALERRLTRERATLAVYEFVDALSLLWDDLPDLSDDPSVAIDLVRVYWNTGIGLPTLPAAISHIEDRLRRRRPLDERSLISTMAPWSIGGFDKWK